MDTPTANTGVHITPDGRTFWNVAAVAAALCVSEASIRRWARRAGFPRAYKIGTRHLWDATEIIAWRDSRQTAEPLATPTEWRPERPLAGATGPRRRSAA